MNGPIPIHPDIYLRNSLIMSTCHKPSTVLGIRVTRRPVTDSDTTPWSVLTGETEEEAWGVTAGEAAWRTGHLSRELDIT